MQSMPGKTIILAKPPDRGPVRASSADTLKSSSKPNVSSFSTTPTTEQPPPTRILKAKEDGGRQSSSPAPVVTPTTPTFQLSNSGLLLASRDNDDTNASACIPTAIVPPIPKIHIQQKSSNAGGGNVLSSSSMQHIDRSGANEANSLDVRLSPYPEMKCSVKLIDESLQWCDQTFEFLQDQCDFLVVGVLGLQGTGKSTVMSLLAGNQGFKISKAGVFKPQTKDQRELGEHGTRGIDIFVTNHRLILLDVQPLLSPSVMDHMIQFEKKFPSEYSSTENALEIQSLQMAAFLLTVCQTVILVQDWFTDPNLLRFVQTAEMLRPSALLPSQDGGSEYRTEYCPHLVFVHNKCSSSDFEPYRVKLIEKTYAKVFHKSKLKFQEPVGIVRSNIMPSLRSDKSGYHVNCFLIPWNGTSNESSQSPSSIPGYKGHPGYEQLTEDFRHQIASMPRSQMQPAALTEKNWFHYAARIWESVKKSALFMEYCRLLA